VECESLAADVGCSKCERLQPRQHCDSWSWDLERKRTSLFVLTEELMMRSDRFWILLEQKASARRAFTHLDKSCTRNSITRVAALPTPNLHQQMIRLVRVYRSIIDQHLTNTWSCRSQRCEIWSTEAPFTSWASALATLATLRNSAKFSPSICRNLYHFVAVVAAAMSSKPTLSFSSQEEIDPAILAPLITPAELTWQGHRWARIDHAANRYKGSKRSRIWDLWDWVYRVEWS